MPKSDTSPRSSADGERVLSAHLAYLGTVLPRAGGTLVERDGVVLWQAPHALPFLVNGAARVADAPGDRVLAAARAFFEGHGHGYELMALGERDDDLLALAAAHGAAIGPPGPLQALRRLPDTTARPGIDVREVVDERGVRDVTSVARDAHEVYGFPDDLFPTLFNDPASIIGSGVYAFVGYDGDAPVATAQVLVHAGLAYIGWVAVARASMRRGLGTMITATAVAQGFAAGAGEAVLLASPMGAPLYRRMGFEDVGTVRGALFQAS